MGRTFILLFCFLVLPILTGCARAVPSVPLPTATAAQPNAVITLPPKIAASSSTLTRETTATPEPAATSTPVPLATPIPNESGLTIEENEIAGKIEIEPLRFRPVHGSQAAVMARHAEEKQERFSYAPVFTP